MAATSLKISDKLKRSIERLAATARQTPHAFMVEALTREAERGELRTRFAAEAADSEKESMASGKAYDLATTFDYLTARVAGKKVRRPRAHAWRTSK